MEQKKTWRKIMEMGAIDHVDKIVLVGIVLAAIFGFHISFTMLTLLSFAILAVMIPTFIHIDNKCRKYIPRGHRDTAKFNPDHPGNDRSMFVFVSTTLIIFMGTSWATRLAVFLWSHLYWK